jgi:hypothetical protein
LRETAEADHWLSSDVDETGVLLECCDPFERIVDPDAADEFDDNEDEELFRDKVFRGTNMPRLSSGFIELFPSIEPHAARDICGNVGGLATAVMRMASGPDSMSGSDLGSFGVADDRGLMTRSVFVRRHRGYPPTTGWCSRKGPRTEYQCRKWPQACGVVVAEARSRALRACD